MGNDPKAVARRYYEILSHWEPERLEEVCASDLRGHAGAGRDLTELKTALDAFIGAFPDLEVEVEHLVADGDLVSSWVTMTGTHEGTFAGATATGKPVKFVAWDLMRVADGRIVEMTSYCDLFTLMSQIDALASPTHA